MQELKNRIIKDIMVTEVVAVRVTDSPLYVLEIFNEYHVHSVPVLNEEGNKVLGYITERMLLKTLGEQIVSSSPKLPDITDFITKNVLVVKENDGVTRVLGLFSEFGVKSALVVNEEEMLTGVITRRELLRSMEDCVHHEHGGKHSRRVPIRITEKYREQAPLSLAID